MSAGTNDDRPARGGRALRLTAIGLGAGRLAIGAGIWLAPGFAGRALGFGSLDPTALALGRIAATRDLVLGAWQLRSLGDRAGLRRATIAAALADAGDVAAFGLVLRGGGETRIAGLRGLAAAVPATAAGLWLADRLAADV